MRLSLDRLKKLEGLERKLKVSFQNLHLLNLALTHRSYSQETGRALSLDNQRLEFLGDAIISLIVSEHIYKKYPQFEEGKLSKIKAVVVSGQVLSQVARKLGVGDYLLLGRGEEESKGREKISLLADSLEAVAGAVYLDGDYEKARKFVLKHLGEDLKKVAKSEEGEDYKSILQEYIQKRYKTLPFYEVIKEEGPPHQRRFTVRVRVKKKIQGIGKGSRKQEAEQESAKVALKSLRSIERGKLSNKTLPGVKETKKS